MAVVIPLVTEFDSKGIRLAEKRFKDFQTHASKVGQSLKQAFLPAAAAIGAVATVGVSAIKSASDLGESVNAVGVTFGEATAEILKLSDAAATSVGLSKKDFNSLAVQFASFAKKIAGKSGSTAKVIEQLTQRAADFASVMNIEVADAAAKFQSGLAGEAEPLKRFGIDLSDAAVKAYAAANGIGAVGKAGGKLTEAEKVIARYGLIMQETSKHAGDFANTSDSLANQQRILKAEFENIKAELGVRLLPVVQSVAKYINDRFIPYMQRFAETFREKGLSGALRMARDDFGKFIMDADGWKGTIIDLTGAVIALGLAIKGLLLFNAVTSAASALSGVLSALGTSIIPGVAVSAGVVAGIFVSLFATVTEFIGLMRSSERSDFFEYLANTAKLIANGFIAAYNAAVMLLNLPIQGLNLIPGVNVGTIPLLDYYDFTFDTAPSGKNYTGLQDSAQIQINVNGALDPVMTGKQIADILARVDRRGIR